MKITVNKKQFIFKVEKTGTGYSAFCKSKSIFTTGKNMIDLSKNAKEATKLYLECE